MSRDTYTCMCMYVCMHACGYHRRSHDRGHPLNQHTRVAIHVWYVFLTDFTVLMAGIGEYATCASEDKSFEAHINLDKVVAVEMVQSKVHVYIST